MKSDILPGIKPLAYMWPVINPFLYCVHHFDHYPAGNAEMDPAAILKGRHIWQGLTLKNDWLMCQGDICPSPATQL